MNSVRIDPHAALNSPLITIKNEPTGNGTYLLLIEISSNVGLRVGKLGNQVLEAGYYLYVGSALNGLRSRISRHLQVDKKLHWHIDYLTKTGNIIGVFWTIGITKVECQWAQLIMSTRISMTAIRGFGSSDCRCTTHLYFFPDLLDVKHMLDEISPEHSVMLK